MRRLLMCSSALIALVWAGTPGFAQDDNMEKLGKMQPTGTEMSAFGFVPQTGDYAKQLRDNLKQIKLPKGFKINLYAVVPDARHMAVGPQGVVTFVGTRKDAVWAVTDRNKDGTADEVKRFAQRCLLFQGWVSFHRRTQPHTHLPGGGVLLREP